MKKISLKLLLLIIIVIALSACSGIKYTKGDMINESNADLIDVAAKDAAAQIAAIPRTILDPQKKYVVMSTENINGKDKPRNALIIDSIVSSLTQAGFFVLERDEDILLRIAYQENGKNLKSFFIPPTSKDAKVIQTEVPKYDIDYGKKVQVVPAKVHENLGTEKINTADFIISYRILETGVKYFKVMERSEIGETQIKRSALVKLNIRIIDAKTSRIIYSDTLTGNEEDLVPTWQVKFLQDSGYEFYPFTLPLQQKQNSNSDDAENENKE